MRLEIGLYGVLLASSLGAAYWASLPTKEGDEQKVALVSIEPKQVTEISFVSKDTEVTATRRDGDSRFWVNWKKTETIDPPKSAQATSSAASTATGTGTQTSTETAQAPDKPAVLPKVKTERFLGNEKVDEVLASFAPLQALRVIGKVDGARLKEYGLDDASTKLVVKSGGQSISLVLGKKSYGSRNRFALEGERVVLIDDQAVENIERANLRLYDRRLVAQEFDSVQKAEIAAAGKSKRMNHTQRDKNGELLWSDDEEGATGKPAYGSFMDKISKLRLSAYADPEQQVKLDQVPPFLEIALENDGKIIDKIVLKKLPDDQEKSEYFVTSNFLKSYGKLPAARVEPIEKDIEPILTDK